METSQGGFTLIELMIVIAVLAFLLTIALPAYQNYVVRTKVSEIMVFGDSARSNVSEYYLSSGHMPGSADEANLNTDSDQSEFIGAISFSTTVNTATVTYTVDNLSVSGDIALVGTATSNGMQWSCSTPATTLDSVYLPQNCR